MIHNMIIMMCCVLFSTISSMQKQHETELIHILLQDLVQSDNKNSIVIVPFKTNDLQGGTAKRKESEKILSNIALNGVRVCLELNIPQAGKSFLVVDNKGGNCKKNPTRHSDQGSLCKKAKTGITNDRVNCQTIAAQEASYIIYNMPYYRRDADCFYCAYLDDLYDHLRGRQAPCLAIIDEDVYSREDIVDEIYRRFCGKKKILLFDKKFQKYTEYQPSLVSQIGFPIVMTCGVLVMVGLFYLTPSGLATALDTTF